MALRFDCAPVSLTLSQWFAPVDVVAQQRRRLVVIDDQDVDVAIVVEVAEGAAAAGVQRLPRPVPPRPVNSSNCPLPRLRKTHARRRRSRSLQFRIDAAGHPENIRVAVVVEVRDADAPADVARLDAEPGREGDVAEIALAVVDVQRRRVVGEVGLEDIEIAVQLEVADRQTPCRPAPCRLRSGPRRAPGLLP